MATTIVTKNGSGAPTASDLVAGELAVDLTNKRLYTEDSGGTVLEVGSNPYNFTANHDGSAKLATTATGIDVTGTVTADGLTVDGSASFTSPTAAPQYTFASSHVGGIPLLALKGAASAQIRYIDELNAVQTRLDLHDGGAVSIVDGSSGDKKLEIASTGDISFYEDTGTTAKLFWDASAESLGIGTTSPTTLLELKSTSATAGLCITASNAHTSDINMGDTDDVNIQRIRSDHSDNSLQFTTNNVEAMRIDASGSILFGSAGQGYISGTVANTYNSGYNQDDDSWATWMNYYGYQNGATRYRDFIVGDGKTGRIATFDGSSGNVGIGTSNPTANLELSAATSRKLDVVDTTGARVRLSTASGQGFLGTTTNHDQLFITNDTERMRIDTSGNVGIGTTSPDHALEITAANGSQFKISRDLSPDTQYMTIGAGGNSVTFDSYETSTHSTYIWESSISGSTLERMRIDASGNVGIGLTNPADYYAENLVVAAADEGGITIECAATEKAYLMFARGTSGSNAYRSYIGYDHNVDSMNIVSSGYMNFYTDFPATEKMRIDESGNLLVGGALADVNGLATNHLFEGANSTVGTGAVGVYNNTGTASCPALVVLNRDASTDSSNRFVQFYANVTSSTNTAMGGIVGNGASNVQFASISDVREKTNIESITGSLDKITSLNPVEFDWIASGEHVNAGFVAQEVEEVFPEFVVENMASEGQEERKGLTGGMTGGIVAHLVKAIQEQQATIEALTARIAALES